MALIAAERLSIGPAGRSLAGDIAFTLSAGQIIAVLGANGVGKSTLFHTLLHLQPARSGSVLLDGIGIGGLSRPAIARRVAFVPQAIDAPFPLTVLDFVVMGRTTHLRALGRPSRADFRAAGAALSTLGIAGLAQEAITRLSGGERQLALIARALAQGSPALILDEPAAALDFANRERLAEVLTGLAGQGKGILFSTHDPRQAARLASAVLCLFRSGRACLLPVDRALDPETLAGLYDMPVDAVRRGLSADPASGSRAAKTAEARLQTGRRDRS